MHYVRNIEKYINGLIEILKEIDKTQIENFTNILKQARDNNNTIFVFGNGGSGSTCSHMAGDLNKGCSYKKKHRFRVICLNDNLPILTAYANDVDYAEVFVEQLKNFMQSQDVVIGISGSGNSENVIKAIDYANDNEAITVGLCGFSGGLLKRRAQITVHVKVDDMQKVEDIHLILNHIAVQILQEDNEPEVKS